MSKKLLVAYIFIAGVFKIADGFLLVALTTVFFAVNGQEAVNMMKVKDANYDIILMNIQMPVMNGITAMELLKNDENCYLLCML